MRHYKIKRNVNYLMGRRKYLLAYNIIKDFCKDKYDNQNMTIMYPKLNFMLGKDMENVLCRENFDTFAEVNPSVIIYCKRYYEPIKVGFEYDFEIKEAIKIYVKINDNVWSPLVNGEYSGVEYYSLFQTLADIEAEIDFDYKNRNLQNVSNICIYAINVPDVDLVTTDLIPKLIENKIEIN